MSKFWNNDLIQRYDLRGPRYTSYPTAHQFKDEVDSASIKGAIQSGNKKGTPLSLYFHIPFCDTVCYYCACNKIITANKRRARPYLERLHEEITLRAKVVNTDRVVSQLHWGGGTPTYINHDQMTKLMAITRENFSLLDDDSGEYSIEIHPAGLSAETITHLRKIGFNRLSIGVQDFNVPTQHAVNRFNSFDEVAAIVKQARKDNFQSVSVDLIYGLPHQSTKTLASTLKKIMDLSPDRLSLFSYAHLPERFKTQRQINQSALPNGDEKIAMLKYAIETLSGNGYVYIGMDHFAKPGDELTLAQQKGQLHRNFQGYSTRKGCDLLGFGVSSISAIENIYIQNHKSLDSYNLAIDSQEPPFSKEYILTPGDIVRREVINKLICHFSVDFCDIEARFNIDFSTYFKAELKELKLLAKDGLIRLARDNISVTDEGRLLVRRVCSTFDEYSKRDKDTLYSKLI